MRIGEALQGPRDIGGGRESSFANASIPGAWPSRAMARVSAPRTASSSLSIIAISGTELNSQRAFIGEQCRRTAGMQKDHMLRPRRQRPARTSAIRPASPLPV